MNTKKLVLAGAVAAVGLLGFATVGLAFAQPGDGPTPTATVSPTGHHGHMGNNGTMTGHMGQMGQTGQAHDQMHDAVAKALGITVDELNAQLKAGKSVPDIAREKGIDMATITAAMQAAHPDSHGPGMMGDPTTHADCPNM
jgi:hypothetical protein